MASVDQVRRELAALQRGRGLRRPDLPAALGPALSAAFQVSRSEDPRAVATRMSAALRPIIAGLPSDLRVSFVAALGLADSHPFLKDRLDRAAQSLDRNVRTVRRRLAEANDAVAAAIASSARPGDESLRWYVEDAHVIHDLTTARPRVTAHRTIRATVDGLTECSLRFGLRRLDEHSDVLAAVGQGAELVSLTRLSTRVWAITVRLERVLSIGELGSFSLAVTSPQAEAFSPYNVMIPVRLCRSFRATTHFDPTVPVAAAWRVEGELPALVADGSPSPERYDVGASSRIEATFTDLLPGLAYGLAWQSR